LEEEASLMKAEYQNEDTTKFMQTLEGKPYSELRLHAKHRGITLQQLLRAIIIPEWLQRQRQAAYKAKHLKMRKLKQTRPE